MEYCFFRFRSGGTPSGSGGRLGWRARSDTVGFGARNYPAIQFPEGSNGLARGFEGLAKGAMAISDTFANIKDGEEEVQKAQLLNDTALQLTQAKQRVDTNPDADQRDYLTRWKAEVKPIREQAQEQIRSFETRRQADHATIQLGSLLTRAEIHATDDAKQLSLDNQRAQGMQSLSGLANLAAHCRSNSMPL